MRWNSHINTAPRRLQALGSTRRASDTETWLASTNRNCDRRAIQILIQILIRSLVGGIATPLKNDGVKVSWDYYSQYPEKIKNVPNHQPGHVWVAFALLNMSEPKMFDPKISRLPRVRCFKVWGPLTSQSNRAASSPHSKYSNTMQYAGDLVTFLLDIAEIYCKSIVTHSFFSSVPPVPTRRSIAFHSFPYLSRPRKTLRKPSAYHNRRTLLRELGCSASWFCTRRK